VDCWRRLGTHHLLQRGDIQCHQSNTTTTRGCCSGHGHRKVCAVRDGLPCQRVPQWRGTVVCPTTATARSTARATLCKSTHFTSSCFLMSQIFIATAEGVPLLASSGVQASPVISLAIEHLRILAGSQNLANVRALLYCTPKFACFHALRLQLPPMSPRSTSLSDYQVTLDGTAYYVIVRMQLASPCAHTLLTYVLCCSGKRLQWTL
jgi:hypothetical protein